MQTKITNELLFEDIKEGDIYAYEILFQRYHKKLCRYSHTIVGSWEIAEEIGIDVLHKLWTNREKINISTGVEPYLYKAIYNTSLNYLRDTGRSQVDILHFSEFDGTGLALSESFVTESYESESVYETLDAMISRLPHTKQQIITWKKAGMTHKDIAWKLNLSEKKVSNLVDRIIQKMRAELINTRFNSPSSEMP